MDAEVLPDVMGVLEGVAVVSFWGEFRLQDALRLPVHDTPSAAHQVIWIRANVAPFFFGQIADGTCHTGEAAIY